MKVELTRLRIKPDKIARVDEWLRELNQRIDECVATFAREKMYVEVVFRERYNGEDFLYWFSIQHESGELVSQVVMIPEQWQPQWTGKSVFPSLQRRGGRELKKMLRSYLGKGADRVVILDGPPRLRLF